MTVFPSLWFSFCAVLCAFFVGMFVLSCLWFFNMFFDFLLQKSCLAVCAYFFVLFVVLFSVKVFPSLWFFVVLSGVHFFACLFASLCFFLCFHVF